MSVTGIRVNTTLRATIGAPVASSTFEIDVQSQKHTRNTPDSWQLSGVSTAAVRDRVVAREETDGRII